MSFYKCISYNHTIEKHFSVIGVQLHSKTKLYYPFVKKKRKKEGIFRQLGIKMGSLCNVLYLSFHC